MIQYKQLDLDFLCFSNLPTLKFYRACLRVAGNNGAFRQGLIWCITIVPYRKPACTHKYVLDSYHTVYWRLGSVVGAIVLSGHIIRHHWKHPANTGYLANADCRTHNSRSCFRCRSKTKLLSGFDQLCKSWCICTVFFSTVWRSFYYEGADDNAAELIVAIYYLKSSIDNMTWGIKEKCETHKKGSNVHWDYRHIT